MTKYRNPAILPMFFIALIMLALFTSFAIDVIEANHIEKEFNAFPMESVGGIGLNGEIISKYEHTDYFSNMNYYLIIQTDNGQYVTPVKAIEHWEQSIGDTIEIKDSTAFKISTYEIQSKIRILEILVAVGLMLCLFLLSISLIMLFGEE